MAIQLFVKLTNICIIKSIQIKADYAMHAKCVFSDPAISMLFCLLYNTISSFVIKLPVFCLSSVLNDNSIFKFQNCSFETF